MARPHTRFGLSIPFVFAAMVLAFGVGTYFGGKFLVPPGQGLAAPAEAMGYGLLAALTAMALAALAAVKMPMKALGLSALAGLIISVSVAGALTFAFTKAKADRDDYIRGQQTRQTTAAAAEPACPRPGGDATNDGSPPCPDE